MPPVQEALPGVPAVKEMALTPAGVDPMLAMMERLASNKDVDVEKLRALIEMQKDIMAVNAKAAFDAAFAKMQPRIPAIIERAKTDKATYAPLEDIVEVVRPILSEFGFAINHRSEFLPDGKIKIVGKLKHEQGHAEESEFVCAADQTGSKNAIQALGSSNHYGRRYTTKDLLNIVTKGEDDDGRKAGMADKPDPPAKFEQWWTDLQAVADNGTEALEKAWHESPKDLKAYVETHMRREKQTLKKKAESKTLAVRREANRG